MLRWDKAFRVFISRITPRDVVLLIHMTLLCLLGMILLIRTLLTRGPLLGYLLGFGLLAAGVARGYNVYKVLGQVRRAGIPL